jgi:hypothetical protein
MKRLALSVATALGTAAVVYALFPGLVGVVAISILFSHELGHIVAGILAGGEASPPVYIPLGWILLGVSKIKGLSDRSRPWVAMAGPGAGVMMALVLMSIAWWTGNVPLAWMAAAGLVFELYAATFGSDGRKFRAWRKRARHADTTEHTGAEHGGHLGPSPCEPATA